MKQLSSHNSGKFLDYQQIFREMGGSMNKRTFDEELHKLEESGDIYSTGDGMTYALTS